MRKIRFLITLYTIRDTVQLGAGRALRRSTAIKRKELVDGKGLIKQNVGSIHSLDKEYNIIFEIIFFNVFIPCKSYSAT